MEPDDVSLTFRVQYLADTDPFNSVTMFPIPSRAPTYAFAGSTPLATQLGAILRLLGAPQRVSDQWIFSFLSWIVYFIFTKVKNYFNY